MSQYPPFMALTQSGVYQLPDGDGTGDVVGPASATDGNLAVFDGTTGKLLKDGGGVPSVTGMVVGPASATNLHIALFDGATGKLLRDSGKVVGSFTAAPVAAPAHPTDPGTAGTWAYDAGHLYICTGTGAWLRFAPDGTFI